MTVYAPQSVLLDAQARARLAARARSIQGWATVVERSSSTLWSSTLTLTEVTDGSERDARVRQAVKAIRLHPVTPEIAYLGGRLRAAATATRRKPRDLTVDAVVGATAMSLPAPTIVLTSDPEDLSRLLAGTRIRVEKVA